MKFSTVIMALTLAIFGVALPSLAQNIEKPNEPVADEESVTMGQPCLKRAGGAGNKQGKNYRQNCPDFADFDLDGDGSITGIEFDTAHQGMFRQHMNEGRKLRKLAGAPGFNDIDTDGNGRLSREEFAAHQASRQAM